MSLSEALVSSAKTSRARPIWSLVFLRSLLHLFDGGSIVCFDAEPCCCGPCPSTLARVDVT